MQTPQNDSKYFWELVHFYSELFNSPLHAWDTAQSSTMQFNRTTFCFSGLEQLVNYSSLNRRKPPQNGLSSGESTSFQLKSVRRLAKLVRGIQSVYTKLSSWCPPVTQGTWQKMYVYWIRGHVVTSLGSVPIGTDFRRLCTWCLAPRGETTINLSSSAGIVGTDEFSKFPQDSSYFNLPQFSHRSSVWTEFRRCARDTGVTRKSSPPVDPGWHVDKSIQ